MDVWSDPHLGNRLRAAIGRRDSEKPFRSTLSPTLAYGRHRGPAIGSAGRQPRHAAVLIALIIRDGQWVIPLTLRPMTLSHHGGQICLPGGQIETGESPFQAAQREYHEELGVAPIVQAHCGELSRQYVFGSDNRVHSVVVTLEKSDANWHPDPAEVAEVLTLPLQILLDRDSRTVIQKTKRVRQVGKEVDRLSFSAPAIQCGNHVIWGATAMILDELAQLLHP